MSKSNYRLPGLPGLPPPASNIVRTTPLRNTGLSKLSGFNKSAEHSLSFGRASRAATRNPTSSGSAFSQVFSASASGGGLGGTISQALGFSGGIGSLISGISSLFGGGKTVPPALSAYQLPSSQTQVISTGSTSAVSGVYGGPSATTPFENQSGHIVQSVKQALLTSSALNDVITEL